MLLAVPNETAVREVSRNPPNIPLQTETVVEVVEKFAALVRASVVLCIAFAQAHFR